MYRRKVNLIKLNQSCNFFGQEFISGFSKCPLTVQKQNQSGITIQFEVSVVYLIFIHFFALVYLF